ncbi:hypothetical protein D9M68_995490 [compost metagenome]
MLDFHAINHYFQRAFGAPDTQGDLLAACLRLEKAGDFVENLIDVIKSLLRGAFVHEPAHASHDLSGLLGIAHSLNEPVL